MNYGYRAIDDVLTFAVNTHSPTTGAESDADEVPTYRVYEGETATPIVTGSMALLDDANTVGLYSEAITLSAANGYEAGKSYTLRIRAVVATIAQVSVRHFSIWPATIPSTVSGSTVSMRQGPWTLRAGAPSDPVTVPVTIGDTFPHVFALFDGRGVAVDIGDATVEVSVVSLTGTVLYDEEAPDSTADERVTWTPSTPWATAGTYRASVRLTTTGGEISTYTGVIVEVSAL